ncbi:hypothetical protein BDZ85DRAFT_45801 [Elsinoe ampelina]|uniref:Uncharacterized protein n=1 Tax=Elsinoe ampelina TaxID=302913 RepID=A0A6A6G1G0_9PEZI|nr:hypothetical protein BDZ85DRAFT_45801 [Elsinoe ampelina]
MYTYLQNNANHSQYRLSRASSDNLPRGISFLHFGRTSPILLVYQAVVSLQLLIGTEMIPIGALSLCGSFFCMVTRYLRWYASFALCAPPG